MTMRVSKDRIDMSDNVLQKAVLKDYGETVVGGASGTNIDSASNYHLSFDGSDYLTVTSYTGITGSTARTVTAWFKSSNSGVDNEIVYWGPNTSGNKYRIYAFATGDVLRVEVNGGHLYGTTNIVDGEWHHVAVVFPSGGSAVTEHVLYVDGVEETTASTASVTVNTTASSDVSIGYYSVSSAYLNGSLDDVRIYSRELSAEEIATMYIGGSVSTTSLQGQWEMNDGTGSSVTDNSGNARTAALTGASWVDGTAVPQSYTIDLTEGNVHNLILNSSAAFTFSNPPASGTAGSFSLYLTQDSIGYRTVAWPSAVTWLEGAAPTLYTYESSLSILTFFTIDAGVTWFGGLTGTILPPAPTTLTYITGTHNGGTSNNSITLPATLLAGDLGVLIAGARNGGNNCSDNVPTDFTRVARSAVSTPNLDYMDVVYAKILETSDISRTIDTVNGDAEGNNFFVFRPDTTIHAFDWGTWEVEVSGASQPAQDSWDLSALTTPAVMFGYAGGDSSTAPSFPTASPAFDNSYQVSSSSLGRYISGYKIYNSAGSTHNIRANDSGDDNTQMTGYIRVY